MSFQPRSSWAVAVFICRKPCGRMAGRAWPLRASRFEESEAVGFGLPIIPASSANHAAAEATGRARRAELAHRRRRREHGPAEILLEPVVDIGPEPCDLAGGLA